MTEAYEFDAGEFLVLEELCRAEDRAVALRRVLATEGLTAKGSKGQLIVHPAATEERRLRDQAARLLRQLDLPSQGGDSSNVTKIAAHRLGQAGARGRWTRRQGA